MRLIDADALKGRTTNFDEEGNRIWHKWDIDNAPTIMPKEFEPLVEAIIDVLPDIVEKTVPAIVERIGKWIPVKDRPMTTEERVEFAEYYGIEYCDTIDEKVFDCPMPEDGQEILVSTRWGVHTDVADNDIDGEGFISHGLEENGDWEGVLAWMPVPEPYKEGDEK